jgi:hypothetical protein
MTDDPDALRILREREQRRALERSRIDEERRGRELELSRLRLFGLANPSHGGEEEDEFEDDDRRVARASFSSGAEVPSPSAEAREEGVEGPSLPALRPIGGAVRPPSLTEFLKSDPMERFDLQRLNTLRLPGIVEAARGDPEVLDAIVVQTEAMMDRVKRELDDPLSAGALLREEVLRWYRESPNSPDWVARMPEQWGGLFAESRVSGGRLAPWLNLRLWSLREHAARAASLRLRLRRGITRDRRVEGLVSRTPSQLIRAEVAQALLDDLATHPRIREGPVPLVRLSELAVRRQVATVNDALALLFNGPESGPFVLLHPNRYPDCEEVQIRPPTGGAVGAALAYSLVAGRSPRKGSARGRSASGGFETGDGDGDDRAGESGEEADAATVWDLEEVAPSTWRRIIKERRRERRRLDSPPKDCRGRPAYAALRELLLEDEEFRQTFLSIRWRGRPAGLPLLASLLQKGSLAPEVATDHEYLEAELGDLVQGDPQWHPDDSTWTTHGWLVVREGSHGEGFRFTARPAG